VSAAETAEADVDRCSCGAWRLAGRPCSFCSAPVRYVRHCGCRLDARRVAPTFPGGEGSLVLTRVHRCLEHADDGGALILEAHRDLAGLDGYGRLVVEEGDDVAT
jgi:hypothetical protein